MDSHVWSDPNYLKLWMYCLMKASHKDHEILLGNQLVNLKAGQFVTGRKSLTEELNHGMKPKYKQSEISWWRYLNNLEKLEMLNIKKTNKYSVVTILKWVDYQESEQQMNNKRTSNEHQMNTNKNGNNGENGKKDNIPFADIVNYLNEKAEKKFRPTTKKTKEVISARWNEGFREEDFYKVIDICCMKWKGQKFGNGAYGDDYLQPSTLFNNKFEERLNWTEKVTDINSKKERKVARNF